MGLSKLPSDSGALISETKISLQPKSLLFCGLAPPPGFVLVIQKKADQSLITPSPICLSSHPAITVFRAASISSPQFRISLTLPAPEPSLPLGYRRLLFRGDLVLLRWGRGGGGHLEPGFPRGGQYSCWCGLLTGPGDWCEEGGACGGGSQPAESPLSPSRCPSPCVTSQ